MTYSELLQQLTVESQDNGEVFTQTNRLERIKSLLRDSSYELLYAGNLALIYGKKGVTPAKARLLVSSHIDTVYTHCFCEETDTHWKGTFDSSATNTALLQLMLENKIGDHVLIAFTGDEEIESRGAQEVKRWCNQQTWYPSAILVLDVTMKVGTIPFPSLSRTTVASISSQPIKLSHPFRSQNNLVSFFTTPYPMKPGSMERNNIPTTGAIHASASVFL